MTPKELASALHAHDKLEKSRPLFCWDTDKDKVHPACRPNSVRHQMQAAVIFALLELQS